MNGDPKDEPERRQAENKFGSGGPWTTDHTPITEFNGPSVGEEMYSVLREDEKVTDEEKEQLEKRLRDLLDLPENDVSEFMKEVNHPPHYNNRKMEAIEIIEMIIEIEPNPKVAYNLSNVCKYLLRFRDKGSAVKDLRKAEWYLNRVIMHLEEEE